MGQLRKSGDIYQSTGLVPVRTVDDLSAVRLLDTEYTNTTGKTMHVIVSTLNSITLAGGSSLSNIIVNNVYVGQFGISAGAAGHQIFAEGSFTVPPKLKYKLQSVTTNGSILLKYWTETY